MELQTNSTPENIRVADEILYDQLQSIETIREWAEAVGYDCPKRFSAEYRDFHSRRPKRDLIKVKLKRAVSLIRMYPDLSMYEVALEIGKKDEKSLYAFFRRHTGKNPTWFRGKRKAGNSEVNQMIT